MKKGAPAARNGVDTALTDAQHRALIAVRDGKVERYYDRYGNRFIVPKNVKASARAVWALERRGLIQDSNRSRGGVLHVWATMELTARGKEAL